MLPFACDYPDCPDASHFLGGGCSFCRKHLCPKHGLAKSHNCQKEGWNDYDSWTAFEAENAQMQIVIDALGIVENAIKLRSGHIVKPVSLILKDLPRGTFNFHVPIEFDDGVRWLARIRGKGICALPPALDLPYMQGEIDTMRWLHRYDVAPVPQVMSHIFTHGDAEFYFMSFISGSPLDTHRSLTLPTIGATIMDYAKINVRRSENPLRLIGSLHFNKTTDTFFVGPNISHFVQNRFPILFPGPWKTAAEKYETRFDIILEDIRGGVAYAAYRETAFLVYTWMKEAVMAYPPYNVEGGDTFVVHEDSNDGHIMVDDNGMIQGLIDWERASVSVACEAFSTPQAFEDVALIDKGSNDLSSAELALIGAYHQLGRPDLAAYITSGKPFQWLSLLVGGGREDLTQHKYLRALGQSLGLEMEDNMDEFLSSIRGRYEKELLDMRTLADLRPRL